MAEEAERVHSIDAFRGLAILLMVAANYLAGVEAVPVWLKHAPDVGLTVIDVIAPMFITAIGLTYIDSARERRSRSGTRAAATHLLRRYLAIAGVGALLAAGEELVGVAGSRHAWGVLQAIGFSGLLVLPLAFAPWWSRLIAGVALLSGYQVLLDRFWLGFVLSSSHGGLPGTLGWAGMLCLATVFGELSRRTSPRAALRFGAALTVVLVGVLLALLVPVSKNRVSSSYLVLSLGICALAYLGFWALCDRAKLRVRHLEAWGVNPLALYLLHELALGLVVLPGVPAWYERARAPLVAVELLALLALLGAVAELLRRRKVVLAL